MRNTFLLGSALAVFVAVPAIAQDAIEEVTMATEEAAQATAAARPPVPATPPIRTLSEAYAEESAEDYERFERYVTPLDYNSVRPTQADYPVEAWRADHEGRVEFRLAVDAEGNPTNCEILQGSGHSALDDATCEILMERGKFDPARDEQGNPIEGTYEDLHYWRKREPEFPGTMMIHVAYSIDAKGRSSDCEVIDMSGAISEQMRKTFEREPCPGIDRPARAPYRDENGNPVARRVEVVLSVKVDELEE